ncbi:MAG: GH3 auxin-responsive promoter family protein [Chloroflexi bacterium]|nr:GH3 auxin-responsive promoter family protein [Chloroflexota bacterium]
MTRTSKLLSHGKTSDLWQKYCGFIDLSLDEFMQIQERLLLEQVQWFSQCDLGRKLIGPKLPASVDEFRQTVPFTTYADYAPYFLEKREDVLPEKPAIWMRTSGRSGEYAAKWAPLFERTWKTQLGACVLSALIFASSRDRNDMTLEAGDNILYTMGPPPLGLGYIAHCLLEEFPFKLVPPAEEAEALNFEQRTKRAFELAMKEGIDTFFGISSILVRIGEQFAHGSRQRRLSRDLLQPSVMLRLAKGIIKSKLARRPMYPKDLWDIKAILTVGMDTDIYRSKIKEYWGKEPLEFYGGTEIWMVACQTWDRDGMTFFPDMSFLEFIPEAEHLRAKGDPTYTPRTVTLREVEAGEKYEVVVTNLGGVFVRYRVGDMIRITSLRNDKLNINIPQMKFFSRCDDVIDLAGFTRLTEKAIWQAIEDSVVDYRDWTVKKEIEGNNSILHLYLEPSSNSRSAEEIEELVHQGLKKIDGDYKDLESITGHKALRVSLLPMGTFARYIADRQAAGVEVAHLKPAHVNPKPDVLNRLLKIAESLK